MSEHELNARRLLCPMPVIRTQDRIAELADGDLLKVTCTDPGVLHDIPAWCRIHGHEVVDTQTIDREMILTIRVHK
ncbi:MAG: sulfurtransferase TusA family protein [Pseudomonadales bacterium]|nr:sulfurtransferase TusA family protein [Pseudomonadales bacterium]MBO6565812.1 sulfurtransferase TusA family protein [Pseudomonadales bacterium]MBO6597758.1 sulfurtransferase TusA family protein [Pseudomonadales bacterium]MBO6655956.1 sulfurtransferase TusA family protein [Pseudomonadales bacterium]MBO6704073.1 sulfurtransferase TusA family protein [Pseudomonadales bacterium]